VLFSEPKIPQFVVEVRRVAGARRFSALQRAENSSIIIEKLCVEFLPRFQCSSASRKFLNRQQRRDMTHHPRVSVLFSEPKIPQFFPHSRSRSNQNRFSALQRAENSSIVKGFRRDFG